MNENLKLLRESFKDWQSNSKIEPIAIPLNESNNAIHFKEARYNVLSAFKIPIWKLDQENQNRRIYPSALGEKVVKLNAVTPILDGHPSDSYTPQIKDIMAIGKNPSIENTPVGRVLFAEIYIVDEEYDKKINRALDLGLSLEQSSSGYGELSGNKVVPESYILERYADLLVNDSSYQVSFNNDNRIDTQKIEKSLGEKKETNNDTNFIETTSNESRNKVENYKEHYIMDKNNFLEYEDKVILRSAKKALKEMVKIEDPKEKLAEAKEILTFFDNLNEEKSGAELKESVQEIITSCNSEILELAEKGKKVESLTEEKDKSIKSLEKANEKIKELEEENAKLKETTEDFNKKLDLAFAEMDNGKQAYSDLKGLYEHKQAEANSLISPEEFIKVQEELEKKSKQFDIAVEILDSIKEAEKKDDKKSDDEPKKDDKEEKPAKEDGEKKDKDSEEKPEKDMKDDKEEKGKESEEKPAEDKEDKDKKEDKSKKKESISITDKINSLKESKDPVSTKIKKLNVHKESVQKYYESLESRYGEAIEEFKESFLNCQTYNEAVAYFFKVKPKLNESKDIENSVDRRDIVDRLNNESLEEKRNKLGIKRTGIQAIVQENKYRI